MIIDGISFLAWLSMERQKAEDDAAQYSRGSDRDERERCEIEAATYTKVIDKITRMKNRKG